MLTIAKKPTGHVHRFINSFAPYCCIIHFLCKFKPQSRCISLAVFSDEFCSELCWVRLTRFWNITDMIITIKGQRKWNFLTTAVFKNPSQNYAVHSTSNIYEITWTVARSVRSALKFQWDTPILVPRKQAEQKSYGKYQSLGHLESLEVQKYTNIEFQRTYTLCAQTFHWTCSECNACTCYLAWLK